MIWTQNAMTLCFHCIIVVALGNDILDDVRQMGHFDICLSKSTTRNLVLLKLKWVNYTN